MNPIIHAINLKSRLDRRLAFGQQMYLEKCDFQFWDGVEGGKVKANIHAAHKQIIQHAKEQGWNKVVVAEDDLVWTAPGAWKYFLDNEPPNYDLYVSSYYSGSHDENNIVTGLRGLTLYICHSRYYDTFLGLSENIHLDAAIAMSGAKVICSPMFCAIQAPGFSDQRKQFVDDSKRLKGKKLFL